MLKKGAKSPLSLLLWPLCLCSLFPDSQNAKCHNVAFLQDMISCGGYMAEQVELLDEDASYRDVMQKFDPFVNRIPEEMQWTENRFSFLMVNITRRCNLACAHCFVGCGPQREEHMSKENLEACLDVCQQRGFDYLDITGGAPEMNPHFEWFIREAAKRGIPTTLRSNLCVLELPEYSHLPELYAELGIAIVASLPHYKQRNSEKQRGSGSFAPTIEIIKKLNDLGYGKGHESVNANGKPLVLNLVFNPAGAIMPPEAGPMESEYKRRLAKDFGIVFDSLFVFTNVPTGRFGKSLLRKGTLDGYMKKLIDAFNPCTVEFMQCRSSVDVGPDGRLYDCEFNQSEGLDLPCLSGSTIADLLDPSIPLRHKIAFANHCYACTAGSGSS